METLLPVRSASPTLMVNCVLQPKIIALVRFLQLAEMFRSNQLNCCVVWVLLLARLGSRGNCGNCGNCGNYSSRGSRANCGGGYVNGGGGILHILLIAIARCIGSIGRCLRRR